MGFLIPEWAVDESEDVRLAEAKAGLSDVVEAQAHERDGCPAWFEKQHEIDGLHDFIADRRGERERAKATAQGGCALSSFFRSLPISDLVETRELTKLEMQPGWLEQEKAVGQ